MDAGRELEGGDEIFVIELFFVSKKLFSFFVIALFA